MNVSVLFCTVICPTNNQQIRSLRSSSAAKRLTPDMRKAVEALKGSTSEQRIAGLLTSQDPNLAGLSPTQLAAEFMAAGRGAMTIEELTALRDAGALPAGLSQADLEALANGVKSARGSNPAALSQEQLGLLQAAGAFPADMNPMDLMAMSILAKPEVTQEDLSQDYAIQGRGTSQMGAQNVISNMSPVQ
ncbi:PREDICTED: uncharacterized protein LOC109471968 [Branchiostoma belcheri]|uniref:Uncharacterized protein LOC109471968 n=1 Tax=Branchiostoma belcheri TaxID=7741 RepID=A0A6P4ZBJ6_BRABE|nr:PREDICTED: uncharacterized protein LOC109471968 [Branchiostoma belcheri]